MSVDASAVARVLGITTQFKDLRGGAVLNLPQRIGLIAQGQTGVSYPTTKRQVTSAGEAGAIYGFRSAIYLALRELFPVNGDGVGTIPVTVYPLVDDAAGVAASGDITPSGTATDAASYRVKISGIQSQAFVIPAGAVNVTDACRKIGRAIEAVHYMPMLPTYAYGSVTAAPASGNVGNGTVTSLSIAMGGAPMPGTYVLTCTEEGSDAGVFSLVDPEGTTVADDITIGANTENGINFTVGDGSTDFAEGDSFNILVPATRVNLTATWEGENTNALTIEIESAYGVTFAITQPTGGLVNPAIDGALAQVGSVWETFLINALNIEDTTALDALKDFAEGRWGTLVHAPCIAITGNTEADWNAATVISGARPNDRGNSQAVAPASPNLPFVVAARTIARVAKVANDNPPTDYGAQELTGITPGPDGAQWDYLTRDAAMKRGSSTVEKVDGALQIGDLVTFYRPTGEEPPAYRYVCDIVKLQNIIFNLRLIFAAKEWAAAPLVPDDQPVTNPNARQPRSAKAAVNKLIDNLALAAIISDPKTAKKNTVCWIDSQNPKRLNVKLVVQLAGNTNVKSIELFFGFYFGQAPQLAA